MSLSSLVSAVQTAVDMSDAAVSAATEALAAAKLAGLQAKAALAAAHLALEIDTNMKNVGGNNNDGNVPNANIETKPTPADLKTINSTGVEEVENTTYNPANIIYKPSQFHGIREDFSPSPVAARPSVTRNVFHGYRDDSLYKKTP